MVEQTLFNPCKVCVKHCVLYNYPLSSQITSNATSDLNIKVDGRAIVRGNEGVFIMGKTIEFHMGGNMEFKAVSNSRF